MQYRVIEHKKPDNTYYTVQYKSWLFWKSCKERYVRFTMPDGNVYGKCVIKFQSKEQAETYIDTFENDRQSKKPHVKRIISKITY